MRVRNEFFKYMDAQTEDPIVNAVIHKFMTRSDEGMKKYGQSMADNSANTLFWIDNAQDELMDGILYLENQLIEDAFTSERLEVLKMLSAQLAISIENSLSYENLEQKVEERTQKIVEVNNNLKVSDERYKYALDASNDGIWDWNVNKGRVYLSPKFKNIVSMPSDTKNVVLDTLKIQILDEDKNIFENEIEKLSSHIVYNFGDCFGCKWLFCRP